jgi:predicted TIM-barrel fold metal-dependent hydrolase
MQILDAHMHIGRRDQITPWLTSFLEETISPEALDQLEDMTPEGLVKILDMQGITKGALLAEYSPKTTGIVPNKFIAEFCKGSERLIAVGSIDLDSEMDTGLQTEYCVKELGCRGLKLLPSYAHFFPDDRRLFPAYDAASQLGIPVMFHTGTSLFPGSRIRYANPLLLDDIAEDFQDLNIVMCHAGRPFWYKEAEWMLTRHKNVHIDMSGIPLKKFPSLFPKADKYVDRFIFGSDWPTRPLINEYVRQVQQFPYSNETIEGMLWNNGARLLGLTG